METIQKMYELLKFIFLGLFQGFTEPIPISSSGHTVLLKELFNVNIPGLSFEMFIHFGSLLAIAIFYRGTLWQLLRNTYLFISQKNEQGKKDFYFLVLLFIATIPAAIIGLFFEEQINKLLQHIIIIGIALLMTGVFLWKIRKKRGVKEERDITIVDALWIGLAQAIAIIPGISRSGATIIMGMYVGLKREVALKFSFLLYIPVSVGAFVLSARDLLFDPYISTLIIPYLLAFIASILATFFALRWFINIMLKGYLKYFAYYCFIVGTFVILYFI
ncbi:MAG TPA: undecaprenyl-diphosphate phosphatase [Bacillota bacterium]|nr:undecaprenyl-diphosphate phosphatase [Bacillota bacterium]